ncbi:MAG: hypothetical protein BYD32DRAFT_433258 [Podila humilis]|nr:MAG: hypothetical protein BYD32DRAFT_433258 [Podila humilis]
MHLHEDAIYLKDSNGKVATFVKNDSQEIRDPLTIIVHKTPPDHVIVPLSKGLRIEPERTLSASTRIRKNRYRALFRTKSIPEAPMDSIGAHYYHQTTTIVPENTGDSQLVKIPENLNEIMPPPPPPYAPQPPASQMISTAPMTAQRASGNAQLYPPFPLSSTMMAISVEDPTSLPPLLPARVQPLLPGVNAGPTILAPPKMELDADSQEQHQPQQQQQKQQRVILGQISSGNELVGMQTSHKKSVVATASKDGHSRPTVIEKYIWAMEKSSELIVPAAGMVGDNHDRSHGRDRASPTSSLSSTSAADKLAGMDERMKKLHEIMGRTSCKHFVIDCNFETTKPIRRCITQNTIREILMKAKSNLPVSISTETVRKTPKMKAIDRIIINKYNAILTARIETLKTKDVEQSAVLDRIIQLDTKLNMILATESEMSDYIKIHDTTDYIFIDELDFNEPWRLVDLDRRHTVSFPSQVYPIHRVTIVQEHIYIKRTRGGEGEKFWEIDFKRKAYKKGVLHAKFYTTFAERFKANIMDAQEKLTAAQRDHPGAIQELKEFTENNARLLQEIDVLRQMNKQATDMIAKASEPSVNLAQFEASVARGVYSGDHAEVVELIDMRYRVAISDIW